ncbi:MAG: regulatory signaling modulator protein AmpE [Woeseiaceae bacterium]|nr:regulatory signaling modulator protein AmpE [Woeseiaceae bacterium]
MKLLALLIGLLVERLATKLFHLRHLRWLDRLIDLGFRQGGRIATWPALISVIVLASALVAPVFLIRFGVGEIWFGFPYLILSIIILFFSFGPKDIGEDVEDYCRAIEDDDGEQIGVSSKRLSETDVPEDEMERIRMVEESVCIQANNRLFAVVFWFVLLGPVGAWAYRVTDLIRRRAGFNILCEDSPDLRMVSASETLHGLLAWIPARLTAVGYAMAGSFEGALHAWRSPDETEAVTLHEQSEQLLARVGLGALALQETPGESVADRGVRGVMAANGLVMRLLFIWAAAIAAMTLYGWSV